MKELDYIGGKRIDESLIKNLEKQLEVKFPEAYTRIVLEYNGACIIPDAFIVSGRVESINNFHDISKTYEFVDERLPDRIVPFARDAGDNQICFDFREKNSISVLFWDYGSPKNNGMDLSLIASSFDDFLDMLFEYED